MPKLKEFFRKTGVRLGLLASLSTISAANPEHHAESPRRIVESRAEGRVFSFEALMEVEGRLHGAVEHGRSKEYYKILLKKMFSKVNGSYKRSIRNIGELTPVLDSLYILLNQELPMITKKEKSVVTFKEAYERKQRDCDIGTYLMLEILRSLNLKGVKYFYGHRFTHGYVGIEINGKRYRYETTVGKYLPILEEDVFIPIKEVRAIFDYKVYYYSLFYSNPELARKVLEELIKTAPLSDSEFNYASLIMAKDPEKARRHFSSVFEKSGNMYVYGIGWAYYELKNGHSEQVGNILKKVTIPSRISDESAILVTRWLDFIKGTYVNRIKDPEVQKRLVSEVNQILKQIDLAQKVY